MSSTLLISPTNSRSESLSDGKPLPRQMRQRRPGAMDQQGAQMLVAALGDAEQALLAAGGGPSCQRRLASHADAPAVADIRKKTPAPPWTFA
jgi:hypothetical protein